MKGWKTWLGVAGLVITKVAAIFLDVDMDAASGQADTIFQAAQAIFSGLTVVGIGHKLEKRSQPVDAN